MMNYLKHIRQYYVFQTVLCINEKQMGVAGDDTWGAKTHEEFLLDKNKHHLHFAFKGE